MRHGIWETFVSLAWLPVFLVLWLVLVFSVLSVLPQYMPSVKEYFGIILIIVLTVPLVVFFLYVKRRQRPAKKNAHAWVD